MWQFYSGKQDEVFFSELPCCGDIFFLSFFFFVFSWPLVSLRSVVSGSYMELTHSAFVLFQGKRTCGFIVVKQSSLK